MGRSCALYESLLKQLGSVYCHEIDTLNRPLVRGVFCHCCCNSSHQCNAGATTTLNKAYKVLGNFHQGNKIWSPPRLRASNVFVEDSSILQANTNPIEKQNSQRALLYFFNLSIRLILKLVFNEPSTFL